MALLGELCEDGEEVYGVCGLHEVFGVVDGVVVVEFEEDLFYAFERI